MELVISAIERAIKIEEGKMSQRDVMITNSETIVFDKKLPQASPQFIEELKIALKLVEAYKYGKKNMTPKTGWNVPYSRICVFVEEFDGHDKTQAQVIFTTEYDEFLTPSVKTF